MFERRRITHELNKAQKALYFRIYVMFVWEIRRSLDIDKIHKITIHSLLVQFCHQNVTNVAKIISLYSEHQLWKKNKFTLHGGPFIFTR